MENQLTLKELLDLADRVKDWEFHISPHPRPVGSQWSCSVSAAIYSKDDPSSLTMSISKWGEEHKVEVYYRRDRPNPTSAVESFAIAEWQGSNIKFQRIYNLAEQRYKERENEREQNRKAEEEKRKVGILQEVKKRYFT